MIPDSRPLDAAQLRQHLAAAGCDPVPEVIVLDECGSTNDEAVRLAGEADIPSGLLVVARRQTAGRGRRGAVWFGEPGASLLFSLAIRPDFPPELWGRLTHATGLAVDNVARKYTKDPPGIKWPNDILCRGRKLCGILLESRIGGSGTGLADGEAGNPAFAILGVGFNVSQREDDFPAELRGLSTSLAMESNDGKLPSPARLLAELVTAIRAACARAADDFPGVLQEIRQASTLLGRNVRFEAAGRPVRGRVCGLGPEGELEVRTPAGEIQSFRTADRVRVIEG